MEFPASVNWLLFAGYSGVIFYLSNQTSVPLPGIPGIDKVAHLTEYGGYAILSARAFFPLLRRRPRWTRWAVVVTWCLLYAVSDEMHQAFVPGRSCDPEDALADLTGALTAGGLAELIRVITGLNLTGIR